MIVHLIEIKLKDNTTYRFCDVAGSYIMYQGHKWISGTGFIEINGIGDNIDRRYREYTLTYGAYDPDQFQPDMLGDYRNASIKLWRTELDPKKIGNASEPTDPRLSTQQPSLLINGLIDFDQTTEGENGGIVTFTISDKFAALTRIQGKKYTHESQIADYPYDYGLAGIAELIDSAEVWGAEGTIETAS